MNMVDVGNRIKELRKLRGLSQKEIAKIADINQGQYSRVESGKVEPTLTTLKNICSVLGLSVSRLLLEEISINELKDVSLENKIIRILDLEREEKEAFEKVLDMILSGVTLKNGIAHLINN